MLIAGPFLTHGRAARAQTIEDLQRLSIEELAQVEVTSVSKRAEPLNEAAAAIFVITNEDIRRSGARTLPEALRLAPNLQVQQVDARSYAISARGFNGFETANKLLVQIDGRSIYTPLHSGVFWDLHEPLLDDIDRIEVISGPGGTLYGPNAVNGVVNIITRAARDTQGGLVRATLGTAEQDVGVRYGGKLGSDGAWRVYGTGFDRKHLDNADGSSAHDGWDGYQAGFRLDFDSGSDAVTVQGDVFNNDLDNQFGVDGGNEGHNLLARWNRQLGDGSALQVQSYYDKFERSFLLVSDSLETYDLQAQHNWSRGRHAVVWGAGVRTTRDAFVNNLNPFVLDPSSRRLWVGNVFVQDEINGLHDDLALTLGVKLEQTSFTGLEVLPNARLAWQVDGRTLLWSAVSRAVRTPSRIDRQLVAPGILAPNPNFDSEKLTALEAGYRGQPLPNASLSISVYYNLYDDLRTTELSPSGGFPVRLDNGLRGRTVGVDVWGSYQVSARWRLSAGLNAIDKDFELKDGHADLTGGASLGNDPDFQLLLRSQINPTDALDIDLMLRRVDNLPKRAVPAYTELDARIAWRVVNGLELSVSGFNLLHERHAESGDAARRKATRSVQVATRISF